MNKAMGILLGAGLGAASAYYLDPVHGRRRRALVRDQIAHSLHEGEDALGVIGRDMSNRAHGAAATLRSSLYDDHPDDDVLVARVRSALGRVVSHPSAIDVEAHDGRVALSGPILKDESPLLLDAVWGVRGVRDVRNELEEHEAPGRVPGLQGGRRQRPGRRAGFMQENWSPSARGLAAIGGCLGALYGLSHRGAAGLLAGASSFLLLGRALSNMELRRLTGAGAQRHAVNVQKGLCIHAPVEQVFKLWDDFEKFPQFMNHVHNVRRLEDNRNRKAWRWTVTGPAGARIDFDTVVTAREENRLLAWRTQESSLVQHAGRVRFIDNGDGTTTVDVKMTYNPAAGAVGHVIARVFGSDPKRQMNEDLLRMKTYAETGKQPHDAGDGRERWSERQQPGQDESPLQH